jgi:outer membrane protein with beta-barrel domain
MKRNSLVFAFVLSLFVGVVALAQDQSDKVELSVGFVGTELENPLTALKDSKQGFGARASVKAYGNERFRLAGAFEYNRINPSDSVKVDSYTFGPEFGVYLDKKQIFFPFGIGQFGVTTTYNSDRLFTRKFGFGLKARFGHIVFTPIRLDFENVEGSTVNVKKYSSWVGVSF